MDIYLPIAEMSVNVLVLLGMGAAVGFLFGLFGGGGGFLMTPLLIFIGVPPAVGGGSRSQQKSPGTHSRLPGLWGRRHICFLILAGFA